MEGGYDPPALARSVVEVLAAIPEYQAGRMLLGSRVRASIQLDTQTSLIVPRSAILTEGNNKYIYTVVNDRARRVPVQSGQEVGDMVVVSGILQPGDNVVFVGNYELTDGMSVRE